MNRQHGFTLIEVMMAAGILTCGIVAVASIFSFAIRTNTANRQMAVATSLVHDKMEQFRAAGFADNIWQAGNGTETEVISGERFILTWTIETALPRTVTVIVYAESNALMRRQTELIRATTLVSPTF